jgi:flagellar basal-body rod protein FlgB
MPSDKLFNETISLLERSLDLRSLNHRVLSANIANMDTPKYKAFELMVEEEINRGRSPSRSMLLVRTNPNHFPMNTIPVDGIKLKKVNPTGFSLRGDGNTVDVDRTMGALAENSILYRTAAQLVSDKLKGLLNAIRGGK